ncbi:hypothetical protein [Lactiplantibacillus pentosus]|uniref:hypothetical protein n=1 Tax=Lactiplantibacillus pentosus TaxID=1589 RepID=UPI0021823C21|nr:hypothetical protein [Lactiplantibacillus pentosus]MCT0163829.1 hypothetical protein [Lactiplantibacillus pentosus]
MKNIRIAKDVTWKEVNDHVDAISYKAEEIARMSDKHAVLVQLRALRDFERKDNHDLNLVRNHDIVMNTPALWAYSFYFVVICTSLISTSRTFLGMLMNSIKLSVDTK